MEIVYKYGILDLLTMPLHNFCFFLSLTTIIWITETAPVSVTSSQNSKYYYDDDDNYYYYCPFYLLSIFGVPENPTELYKINNIISILQRIKLSV